MITAAAQTVSAGPTEGTMDTFDKWDAQARAQRRRNADALQDWRDKKFNDWLEAVDDEIRRRSNERYTIDEVPRMSYQQAFDDHMSEWQAAARAMRLIKEYGPSNVKE